MRTDRLVFILVAAALGAAGCGSRNHLSRSYANSNREFFGRQTVNPEAGSQRKSTAGLDTQDARIITQTYRSSMSPAAGGEAGGQGFMIMAPPTQRSSVMPPPSVPSGP